MPPLISVRYYAGSSDASRRRGIVSGVMAAIDSYKSAFRVQMGGAGGGAGRALLKERQRQHELIKVAYRIVSFHIEYS